LETSPAFSTSPAFDTSCNVILFDPTTLTDRLNVTDLGQSFENISTPSDVNYSLCPTQWTPYNTMTTLPVTSSSSQQPITVSKMENPSDIVPLATPAPPPVAPNPAAQLMELFGQFVAQSANQPVYEPKTPEMPAKGYSTAPKFDDEPANLESYFMELEYQFDRCCITSTYNCKVQAVHYLDAVPRWVWHGTEAFESDTTSWEEFKDKIYKLYPGSGSEQCINLSDILFFVDTNAHASYLNEKELGAYYRHLLSDTTMMICSNQITHLSSQITRPVAPVNHVVIPHEEPRQASRGFTSDHGTL